MNATYILLIRELIDRRPVHDAPPKVRRIMRVRSMVNSCLLLGGLSESGVSDSRVDRRNLKAEALVGKGSPLSVRQRKAANKLLDLEGGLVRRPFGRLPPDSVLKGPPTDLDRILETLMCDSSPGSV